MTYNWNAAKIEYITKECTLEDISEKYGIPISTLRKHSAREEWRGQKGAHLLNIQRKAQEEFSSKAVDEIVKSLDREYRIAERISELLEIATAQQTEILTLDENGEPKTKVDLAAVSQVAKILRDVEAVKRSIGGITTKQEDRLYDLNREKLEIEKKRIARELEEEDEGGGVLFLPDQDGETADER